MPPSRSRTLVPSPRVQESDRTTIHALARSAGFERVNEMQASSINRIREGSNLLIVAPTGSGKTEAALLPVLTSLSSGKEAGIRALYITPLGALTRDMIDRVQHVVSSTGLPVA